jgi:hypothetical protein
VFLSTTAAFEPHTDDCLCSFCFSSVTEMQVLFTESIFSLFTSVGFQYISHKLNSEFPNFVV